MKILVTGAHGQLGCELRDALVDALPGRALYTDVDDLDITDAQAVDACVADNAITHIINCAGYTAVDRAESDAAMCRRINVDAVKNLASAADKAGARLLHISTDFVFGGDKNTPYTEDDEVNPLSVYGATKYEGERVALEASPHNIVIRTGWMYSTYGHNFVKTIIKRAHEGLRVVIDQVGTPTYAYDLAQAIVDILQASQWKGGLYQYSDLGVASWYDFAQAIVEYAGLGDAAIQAVTTDLYPTPARRPSYSVMDKNKIIRTYGLEIPYWRQALKDCIARMPR